MLTDLSIIDMLLRAELLPMTLDIEHFSKIKLVGVLEEHDEDGYSIIEDYFAACDSEKSKVRSNSVKREIERGKGSICTAALVVSRTLV